MENSGTTKWVRIGDYIEQCDERAGKNYSVEDVIGISTDKKFIDTKANMSGVSLNSYKVVKPLEFAYVADTSRRGDKIALALNDTDKPVLISSIYTAFHCKDPNQLLPKYLFMLLNRSEFDRYARFNSWGSARETFDWDEMCRIEIPLPSIEVQKELVEVYNGLKTIAEQNEALAEQLRKICEAEIINFYKKYYKAPIGDYIYYIRELNSDCAITLEQGINIAKEFISPQRNNSDLSKRVIVRHGQIAYCSQLNNENVAVAYRYGDDCVVSSVYRVLDIIPDKINEIDKHYLFLHLCRKEFGRYVYWASIGSAYEFLREQNLCEWCIPIPPIDVQRSIVELYQCAERAKKIAADAREKLKNLCPALVQRAANS